MRFFRNLFRSEPPSDNNREQGTARNRNRLGQTTAGDTVLEEYTDGSHSYSYSETEEDVRPPATSKTTNVTLPAPDRSNSNSGRRERQSLPIAAIPPPRSATAVAPEIRPNTAQRAQPSFPRAPTQTNGSASSVAVRGVSGDEGSESSHYNLRSRQTRGLAPARNSILKGSNAQATMSAGSVSQRDTKRAGTKPVGDVVTKPPDPLALSAMPHAASARTTSGVLGNPGKVSIADVNRATLSTLRYLCGELGIPATGSKPEVKERVMNKIKGEPYDGEEVQPLSPPPDKSVKKGRVDDTGAAQSTPASSARRETITTTAGTHRIEGNVTPRKSLVGAIAAMSSKPSSNVAEVPTSNNPGSTAELSSTALSKFDSAAVKQQELRGTDPGLPSVYKDKADSETNSKRSPNDQDPRLVRTQRAVTSGLPSGGGSAAMHGHPSNIQTPSRRGGRPPTAHRNTPGRNERVNMPPSSMAAGDRRRSSLQANASEIREMMRRGSDLVPEHARENRDHDRPSVTTPATATHLEGIRLTSANRNSRRVVDVPPGIDRMSPAGRSLPTVFAGAEGGPPNPTTSANESASTTPRNQRTVGQRDTPAASATDAPTINAQVTPRVLQAPAPALAPLKPIPKRASMNGFVTPGDIVRTFNRYTPRRRPSSSTMEPGVTNSHPSSLFQQGSRPSSERFPSNNVHRIRSSAFGVPLTPFSPQVNKRQSLRAFPLPSSQPSPISGGFNRKRHSTGMSSTPFDGRAGLLNDLRPALRASDNDRRAAITSLNDIRARERWRRDDKGIAMASSAKKILAAIRKTGEENRVLCRGRKPLVPLGAPPSLKRARDEEDTGQPAGKRSRTGGFDSNARAGFTPTSKKDSATPARQLCGLSPRVPYGKRASRTFGSGDLAIPGTPTKDTISTPQTTEKRGRSSMARTESIMGSVDRKRRLGASQSDVKKRASKRRSLSSAAFDAIKDEVNAREKEKEEEEARKVKTKRGVTFAEPVDAAKLQAPEKETTVLTGKSSIETPAATEKPFALDKTVFPSPAPPQESKEFTFNIRETRVSEPPKDIAEPSSASVTVPTPAPLVAPTLPAPSAPVSLPDDKPSSLPVSDEASKNVGSETEPKISFGAGALVKSQTTVSFGQPALANDPKPLPSVSAPSATSPSPGDIVSSVKPVNDESKTPKQPDASETASEKPDTAGTDKPTIFTPKINPVTGGPSYSSSPAPNDAGSLAVAASSTLDSSGAGLGASASPFGSSSTPAVTFGSSSVSFGAPSAAKPSPFGLPTLSASSSAATPSAARKLPFGTNAPSTAGVFGSQTTSKKDNGSSSMALKASSSLLASSSAAPSAISFGAPSSTSAPSFGMSSAAAAAVAASSSEFGASSAATGSGGFAASTPSFAFSAPSFATNSTPFGASSSAFGGAASSNPFGTSASDPFGASKPEAEKSQTPFGASSTTFGTTCAGFGSSSTPFGQSSGSNTFSGFGASAQPSGNPFATFTPSTSGTGSGAVPFGNFPSSFNLSSAAATAPFDFSATTAGTGSNQAGSTPFGGSGPNPFGGGNPSGGFGSNNANSFGNPMSNASPFGTSTGSNPFGQATPSFGAQQQSNTGGFGGFGQPSGGFGQSQPSAPFGGFGQSAQGAFGQQQQPQQQQSLSSEAQNLFGGASQPSAGHFTMGGAAPRPSGQARGRRILRARRSRR